jgi:excisionase family DNA binding protein
MAKRHPTLEHPLLTVADAAEITGVCTKWIRTQISQGNLKSHRFGRLVRISPEDLEAFIKSRRK